MCGFLAGRKGVDLVAKTGVGTSTGAEKSVLSKWKKHEVARENQHN